MSLSIGDKYSLKFQSDSSVYELISIDLGYAQLRHVKLNTIRWSNVGNLVKHEVDYE